MVLRGQSSSPPLESPSIQTVGSTCYTPTPASRKMTLRAQPLLSSESPITRTTRNTHTGALPPYMGSWSRLRNTGNNNISFAGGAIPASTLWPYNNPISSPRLSPGGPPSWGSTRDQDAYPENNAVPNSQRDRSQNAPTEPVHPKSNPTNSNQLVVSATQKARYWYSSS